MEMAMKERIISYVYHDLATSNIRKQNPRRTQ